MGGECLRKRKALEYDLRDPPGKVVPDVMVKINCVCSFFICLYEDLDK